MKELGLYRTSKNGYIPYTADGNGRDRYIVYDNGGMISQNNSVKPDDIRRTGTSLYTKVAYKSVSPYIKSPNFHYHSDGNGRDSYIYSNGGGLIYDSKPLGMYKLTDFLRGNEERIPVNKEKMWLSKEQGKYQQFLRNKEKEIIYRLYEKDKKKFLKKKLENEESENLQTEIEEMKLPKLLDKKIHSNTLDNIFDNEKGEETKTEGNLNLNKKKTNNLMAKNWSKNTLDDTQLMKFLSQINNFDANKKYKRSNKSFNQPYLHLKNVNYNFA